VNAVERYVIDEKGQKVAVILPLTEYKNLQEDLHDLAVAAERGQKYHEGGQNPERRKNVASSHSAMIHISPELQEYVWKI
jgi:PHD/YefM family antitoxin component YafN of YafNO toxin-antitoxin module